MSANPESPAAASPAAAAASPANTDDKKPDDKKPDDKKPDDKKPDDKKPDDKKPEEKKGDDKKEDGEKKDDGDDVEEPQNTRCGCVWLAVVWLVALGFVIFFASVFGTQWAESKPSSSVSYLSESSLEYPTVTVCNWNTFTVNASDVLMDESGAPYVSKILDSCPACVIDRPKCKIIATGESCSEDWTQINVTTPTDGNFEDPEMYYVFFCYKYNAKATTTTTGYAGGFHARFKTAVADPDPGWRNGLTCSFYNASATNNVTLEHIIYNEFNYLPSFRDSFYTITMTKTIFDDNNASTTWQTTSSLLDLTDYTGVVLENGPDGAPRNTVTIDLTVAYRDINILTITSTDSYTGGNFFADFSAIVGTLMGLDFIKVIVTLMGFGWAAYYKDTKYVKFSWDTMNG